MKTRIVNIRTYCMYFNPKPETLSPRSRPVSRNVGMRSFVVILHACTYHTFIIREYTYREYTYREYTYILYVSKPPSNFGV